MNGLLMSRCPRCNACESMWGAAVCKYCGFPESETRTLGQMEIDDADNSEELEDE